MSILDNNLENKIDRINIDNNRLNNIVEEISVGDVFYVKASSFVACNGICFSEYSKDNKLFCVKYLGRGIAQEVTTGYKFLIINGDEQYSDIDIYTYPLENNIFMSSIGYNTWGGDWSYYLSGNSKKANINKLNEMRKVLRMYPLALVIYKNGDAYEVNDITTNIYNKVKDSQRKKDILSMYVEAIEISEYQQEEISTKLVELNKGKELKKKIVIG